MTRRTHPRLTLADRRVPPQWKGKPIVAPLVALAIALWPAKPTVVPDVGRSATVEVRGSMTYAWFPEDGLEWFYLTYTTERR